MSSIALFHDLHPIAAALTFITSRSLYLTSLREDRVVGHPGGHFGANELHSDAVLAPAIVVGRVGFCFQSKTLYVLLYTIIEFPDWIKTSAHGARQLITLRGLLKNKLLLRTGEG